MRWGWLGATTSPNTWMPASRAHFTCSSAPEGAWRAALLEAVQVARLLAAPADSFPSLSALGSEIPPQLPATELGQCSHPQPRGSRASALQSRLSSGGGGQGGCSRVESGRQEGELQAAPAKRSRVPEPQQEEGRKAAALQSGHAAWQSVGEPRALRPRGLPAASQSQRPRTARLFALLLFCLHLPPSLCLDSSGWVPAAAAAGWAGTLPGRRAPGESEVSLGLTLCHPPPAARVPVGCSDGKP